MQFKNEGARARACSSAAPKERDGDGMPVLRGWRRSMKRELCAGWTVLLAQNIRRPILVHAHTLTQSERVHFITKREISHKFFWPHCFHNLHFAMQIHFCFFFSKSFSSKRWTTTTTFALLLHTFHLFLSPSLSLFLDNKSIFRPIVDFSLSIACFPALKPSFLPYT